MTKTYETPFDSVAVAYTEHIVPVFRLAAKDLIELAALQPGEHILDIGTGPGVAAQLAAQEVSPDGSVVGVDRSEEMLAIARKRAEQEGATIEFRRADAEALDFPEGSFDVVLSSFGIGMTDPDRSLPSIRRVLSEAGRFALSQWGPGSRPARVFFELLKKRRVAEATDRLAWLREVDLTARPWYSEFSTPQAMSTLLSYHGFRDVQAQALTYTNSYANSDAYIDMSLSFPLAQAEYEALSPGNQRMFRHEFNALMAPHRGPNRSIISEDAILLTIAHV